MDVRGKTILVTGAGRGIGRSLAVHFAKKGANLALLDTNADDVDETRVRCSEEKIVARTYVADAANEDSVVGALDQVTSDFGRLDGLINNAGIVRDAMLVKVKDGQVVGKMTLAQWQAVVNTNLTGPFLCTQHAFRIMKDQTPRGGRIINNGSISAHAPRPFSAAYTSTKHAITGLTKASNLDGRAYDIAVGQVDIGNAATPMTDRMVNGPGVMQPDGTMKQEPRMDATAVGDAVAYMAGLPLDANVLFMTVMASKMPFVGRG